MAEEEAYSLRKLQWVHRQLLRDRQTLIDMKALLEERLEEAGAESWPFDNWAGVDAVMGSLILGIEHLDQRSNLYGGLICRINLGEIRNLDKERPNLKLVEEGYDE